MAPQCTYPFSSINPVRCVFDKENYYKLNGDVFELILKYSVQIKLHFNYYLAKKSFEPAELSRWLPHLSWTAFTNYFPSVGFKFEILYTTLYKCAVLFQRCNYKE